MKQALSTVGTAIFQTVTGEIQTIMIGKMVPPNIPLSTVSAVTAVLQIWSGGFVTTLIAVASIRVGRFVGEGHAQSAAQASRMVMYSSVLTSVCFGSVFVLLAKDLLEAVTNNDDVINLGKDVMLPSVLSVAFNAIVVINTSGILAGQGRFSTETILSFGFKSAVYNWNMCLVCILFPL